MMIEKNGSIELRDISIAEDLPSEMKEVAAGMVRVKHLYRSCLLYTSPSPRDRTSSRMPSSA